MAVISENLSHKTVAKPCCETTGEACTTFIALLLLLIRIDTIIMSTSTSASSKLFGDCFEQHKGVTDAVLLCVTEGLENRSAQDASNTKSWFLILAGALVFLMQLGFAMLCAGCVRRKNISNTLLKNVMDACGAAIAFFAVGYALAFGGDDPNKGFTFVGNDSFFLTGNVDFGLWFFQYTFSAASVTIIGEYCIARVHLWSTGLFAITHCVSFVSIALQPER